jgi:hypothetical protein
MVLKNLGNSHSFDDKKCPMLRKYCRILFSYNNNDF